MQAERTADWLEKLRLKAKWSWGQRNGVELWPVLIAALSHCTQGHCSYCDSFPIDDTGKTEIDHFRPKANFPREAYDWANLYFVCSKCNGDKHDQYDESLVRPDDAAYRFEDFFIINTLTGELLPRPGKNEHRAATTIRIMNLCRGALNTTRLAAIKGVWDEFKAAERPFRFITALKPTSVPPGAHAP